MASKSAHIFFAILSVVAVTVPIVAATSRGSKVGGWQPISNPNAPEVVTIAKFAVAEHNKEKKASLELVSVLSASSQVVSGTNYRLVISAMDNHAATPYKSYTTVVHSSLLRSLSLISFQPNED
ncbi:cysteine proteinase inhibitor 5-like [Salvia miltiorrhiza]|uniref:cysteine proteinase inhibitor 5-like n=1 Tax=Salvia miltiorrhiza TaxID=226208 RepID=UPI0025AD670D|nr:cysteine proteinase inhibitor 5-like [Salvia miltiorrhiza]